ncbi:MAG: class I SAM-dependent methyltransferase, partial [Chloroflexota bacterium]
MTSYDLVPYPSLPRPQTHPGHLAALASLFGLNPPPVTHCRVLDLGCGDGSNLIPMAVQLPDSQFVGLDLAAGQIAAGQQVISALGLKNITLRAMNLLEVEANLGQFDYIISYGVYSWTPPPVRDKLLAICRKHLAADGVAYISYNVYPGWHLHQMAREMMLYHTRQAGEPAQRAAQARLLLNFLAEAAPALLGRLPTNKAYSLFLSDEQQFLHDQPDAYLLHDLLEEVNQPVYFYQFMEYAARHGLQFLAEADFSTMMTSHFLPVQIAQPLRELAQTGLEMEQYMDFLRNRAFRQTLLCHQEAILDRELKPERLANLYVASPAKPEADQPDLHSTAPEKFVGLNGVSLTVSQPVSKAALFYLARQWPQTTAVAALPLAAQQLLEPEAAPVYSAAGLARAARQLGETLLAAFALNLVELSALPTCCPPGLPEYPVANPLARYQAQTGQASVTNQRHEPVPLADDL